MGRQGARRCIWFGPDRGVGIKWSASASSASAATKRAGSTRTVGSAPKIFTRRTIAEDKITEVEASKLDDSYVDHKNKITVAKYARDWAAGLQAVKIPQPREGDEPERDGARRTAGRNRNVR
jgi:hypothetical protein